MYMGLINWVKKIFRRHEALQSDAEALEYRFKSLENQSLQSATELNKSETSLQVEKDSLQLGIAAGFTGRALRDIESSLARIEAQMITKDWFSIQVKDDLERRLEAIQTMLNEIKSLALKYPEPIRTDVFDKITLIEEKMPLTPKMQIILDILTEVKELSYKDLSERLKISVSALRGLLSTMVRRTKNIERLDKNGSGWVRYVDSIDLSAQSGKKEPNSLN